MMTGASRKRSLERISLLGDLIPDHHALRAGVLSELGRVIPFSAFVWPLSDPATGTGISPMARIPCPEDLPLLIRLKYLTTVGRWTTLAGRGSPVTTLLSETGGNPSQSLVWDILLNRYGVVDVLYAGFADKYGYWGWLDLWRTAEQGAFTADEVRYVAAAVSRVTPALRRSVSRQFFRAGPVPPPADAPDDSRPRGSGPSDVGGTPGVGGTPDVGRTPDVGGTRKVDLPQQGVLTLSEDMAVLGGTVSIDEWLGLLQPGPEPYQHVPAEVLNVAAQLLALEAGVDRHPAWSRVYLGAGRWAMLRASRMGPAAPATSHREATPPLAVTIQACPPEERLDIFARSFGLTPRQRQLLELAAGGRDTVAMAKTLGISTYTVQDQFKQIFDACAVHTRAALLAMALGTAL
ncbi:helix-turn-helix transcriptional regulator [Pseudarthrobacter sp. H3Y2-7]|uniref:helix-turn-helix transcriptional regulator n=1 Tax=Pseudarthrobacter naphthalenicus TaxID=3031328 RepID=UPI0023B0726B|nr:helix-turn-helix transcriptional regulator [Pseudarthrobacter sp. H3Y2-7]MDE8670059.1 helix-turn-helix transcriptional regulator [Pseudarthrobacter sp. H3Y2-7]